LSRRFDDLRRPGARVRSRIECIYYPALAVVIALRFHNGARGLRFVSFFLSGVQFVVPRRDQVFLGLKKCIR
jgi:hypothetical protein